MRKTGLQDLLGGRRRRGFVLILALGLLAIMMIFLIAAQGSVLTTRVQMKRSDERSATAALIQTVLADAVHKLRTPGFDASQPLKLNIDSTEVTLTLKPLAATDEAYSKLPGLDHRPGDALAMLGWTKGGASESAEFLINSAGGRSGAIRLAGMKFNFGTPTQG